MWHCADITNVADIGTQAGVFETTLPVSPAGKVLKRVLRKRFWEGQSRDVA